MAVVLGAAAGRTATDSWSAEALAELEASPSSWWHSLRGEGRAGRTAGLAAAVTPLADAPLVT